MHTLCITRHDSIFPYTTLLRSDCPTVRKASFMAARAGVASCSNRTSTEEGTDSAPPWKDITSTASATVSVLTRVSISGRCTTCASADLASAFRDTFDALEGTAAAGFVLVILLMVRRTRFWPPGVARRRKGEASSAPGLRWFRFEIGRAHV